MKNTFSKWLFFVILILLQCLVVPQAFAATTTVMIDYDGDSCGIDSGCYGAVPGGETYACSDGYGNWNDGNQTFLDPLPDGAVLTQVDVELYGECDVDNTTYTLNGVLIDTLDGSFGPCDCACPPTKTYSSADYPGSFPSYNYGGMNTLNLSTFDSDGDYGCYYAAVVTLTYSDSALAIPTISEWGAVVLFMILTASAFLFIQKRKSAL